MDFCVRHTVQSILHGTDRIDLKTLEESCRIERLAGPARNRVGF